MNKNQLKNGDVVELRLGNRYFVFENFLIRKGGYQDLNDYNLNLECKDGEDWDIMKVYRRVDNHYGLGFEGALDLYNHELFWERKEKPKLNETEKTILEMLSYAGYSYIARDDDEELCAYKFLPEKDSNCDIWSRVDNPEFTIEREFDQKNFKFVSWDTKPFQIDDLLEEE
jgi:hypothetical protein